MGLENAQAPIKIEFVFINGTYYDSELKRTFQPSKAKMFACHQPVILPHVVRQKCTCIDCSAMCPQINNTETKHFIAENSTFIEILKSKIYKLHLITIVAIVIYVVLVILFIFSSLLITICNMKNKNEKSDFVQCKTIFEISL